jgi:ribonuclease R
MVAERDTVDRYMAAYLSERLGNEFTGRISGVAKYGIFVRLDENGADGIVPIRTIGREYFHYDRESNTLMGSDTGMILTLGMRVTVRLSEAEPVAGGIAFELLSIEDQGIAKGPSHKRGFSKRSGQRKRGKAKAKDAKVKRKVARRRK